MASTSETGHNKNVANFNALFLILEEMGGLYVPSNVKIQLQNLNPIKDTLGNLIDELDDKKTDYKNAVAERGDAIAPLSNVLTRVLNHAKSTELSEKKVENIESVVKKIRGDQKPKVINPETAESETISKSQMSYDNRLSNFSGLIKQLASHQEYVPNEEALQIQTLQVYYESLTKLSTMVNVTGNALITARKNRNNVLYTNKENVIDLVRNIKAYLKSLGSEGKPYYKKIVKLKFTDLFVS